MPGQGRILGFVLLAIAVIVFVVAVGWLLTEETSAGGRILGLFIVLLVFVLAQGKVTRAEVALELNTPMDRVQDMVRDLVGKNLFSGAINWKDGVLYSKQASQMKADRKCPNCGGQVELVGKGVIQCPYCGAEVFLAS